MYVKVNLKQLIIINGVNNVEINITDFCLILEDVKAVSNKKDISSLFDSISKDEEFEIMFNNYRSDNQLSLIDFMNVVKYVKYIRFFIYITFIIFINSVFYRTIITVTKF